MKAPERAARRRRLAAAIHIALAGALLAGCDGSGGSSDGGGGGANGFSIADSATDEGDAGTGNLTFSVTLGGAKPADVTVDYATAAGSATAGTDFVTTSGTLTFPPGTTTRTLDVPIVGDLLDENDDSFSVTLSNPTGGASLDDPSATGTIRDDDPLPTLSIADAQQGEGNVGGFNLNFTVNLAPASGRNVDLSYATANGSASSGTDYVATSGTLSFPAGATVQSIDVLLRGDVVVESDESFSLSLSNPVNATLADATATGTILNDDAPGDLIGLDARPSNTTCIAPLRPTGDASVSVVDAFPTAPSFNSMTKALQAPGDANRWFVVEQGGLIKVFSTSNPANASTWIDLEDEVVSGSGEDGLLGMAFHPGWPSTREVFVSYTAAGSPLVSRLSRLILDDVDNPTTVTEQILMTVNQPFTNHNGGDIAFGNDGHLYLGLGDGGSGGDPGNVSQNPTRLLGKMLRIEVVGVAFPSPGYTIPSDNPHAANPRCGPGTNAQPCPEIYASGLRNPWRWNFDPTSGSLFAGDVGQSSREEIDLIALGGNYGWNCREGFLSFPGTGDCSGAFIDPLLDYDRSQGDTSVTGGFVYRGTGISALRGRYVFADFESGRIFAMQPDGSGGYQRDPLIDTNDNISSFSVGADGELYYTAYSSSNGRIRRLAPPGGGNPVDSIPTNLVDTGCVDPTNPTQPATGLVQYGTQAPFWSDSAAKERWLAIPDGTTIDVGTISGNAGGDFAFPNGSVLVKNFRLNGQLVETRLMMRHPDSVWAGYTYEWNDAQTAATRVVGGKLRSVQGQTWIYPSEGACMQCHTAAAGFSLGLEIPQQNGLLTYSATGRTANQLETLAGVGMLTDALPGPTSGLPALADPSDIGESLSNRARAWLHTNCSQCHRPGGTTPSNMDLRFSTGLSLTVACNANPQLGDFGIANARLIAPGDPARSIVVYRASHRDASAMPPIGSNEIDAAGVALLTEWIESLSGCL